VAIVTKGPDLEVPSEVRTLTNGRVPVVMSTDAWHEYQVPGSPFFVLVDGVSARRVGQGIANDVRQLTDLVGRAERDRAEGTRRHAATTGLNGPAREAATDDVLLAAGIRPGDPSLYPRTLDDVFPDGGGAARGLDRSRDRAVGAD
jgi:hypothetical protein